MQNLKRAFLLFPTCFFCIGLLAGVSSDLTSLVIGITLICCSLMLIVSRFVSFRFHLLFASVMFLLGMFFMQVYFPVQNEVLESEKEHFFIAKIDEQLKKGEKWLTEIVTVEYVLVDEKWIQTKEKALMLCESSAILIQAGDRILVKSKFSPIKNKGNPGEFNAENYWISKGVRYQCFGFIENVKLINALEAPFITRVLEKVRSYSSSMIAKYTPQKSQGLVQAILLGDKSNLDIETKNSFSNAGAIHVLAVSGLHVGIIAYLLNAIFKFLFKGRNRKLSVIILLFMLWFYAFITGFSPSVTRAVLMFSILIGAQLFSRNYSALNALAFAALILLVWNPLYLFDPGFQLSFLAMLGIFLVYEKIEGLIYIKNQILRKVWQGTVIGVAAQIFTIPLSLYLFHQFPNYFILSNLGVMLLSNLILGCGIALVAFGKVPVLNTFIGWWLGVAVISLIIVIDWIQDLPGAVAQGFHPSFYWTIISYIVILTIIVFVKKNTRIVAALMIVPLIFSLQLNRFENLSRNEICVFNTNHPTILINNFGKQVCLYSGSEDGLSDAQMLVTNYQRIYPGKADFIEVDKQQISLSNKIYSIEVERRRFYMDINLESKQFRVITSARYWVKDDALTNRVLISAPYLGNQEGIIYHLKNGAFQYYLSSF